MKSQSPAWPLILGALLAAAAVALGAFGVHALSGRVPEARLATWETGVRFQTYHAIGLILVGLLSRVGRFPRVGLVGGLFVAGTVLFSGSLYLLVLTETPQLGAVAPLGGGSFIAGWGVLAWSAWRESSRSRPPRTSA